VRIHLYVRNTSVRRVRTVWPDKFSVRSSVAANPYEIYAITFELLSIPDEARTCWSYNDVFCFALFFFLTSFRDRDTRCFSTARPCTGPETSKSNTVVHTYIIRFVKYNVTFVWPKSVLCVRERFKLRHNR